jgi:hypothetical protein
MPTVEEIIEQFKASYANQSFDFLEEDEAGLHFGSGPSHRRRLFVQREEIAEYLDLSEAINALQRRPSKTSISSNKFREQLVEFTGSRRTSLFAFNDRTYKFQNGEDDGVIIEVGSPSALFLNFFRFDKEASNLLYDRLNIYSGRDLTLREAGSRLVTIKYNNTLKDSPEEAEDFITTLFESCLFQLSYMTNLHLELRDDWPIPRERVRIFSPRRRTGGRSLPLIRSEYDPSVLRFYQRAVATDDPYIQFLSFYHVMEYYFVSVNDKILCGRLSALLSDPIFRARPRHLDKLITTIEDHRRTSDETEMLKSVLSTFTTENDLIEFIEQYEAQGKAFQIYTAKTSCFGQDFDKLQLSENHVFGNLAKRIKLMRNILIHSSDRYERQGRYLPGPEGDRSLRLEVPLLQFIAERIIISAAQPLD